MSKLIDWEAAKTAIAKKKLATLPGNRKPEVVAATLLWFVADACHELGIDSRLSGPIQHALCRVPENVCVDLELEAEIQAAFVGLKPPEIAELAFDYAVLILDQAGLEAESDG